ncbi:MAG TPA: serine/threonine-protein kinase, partial [Bryobacteraceae bacterium]|nr:serine/threonine-protein kinase [Bryobacteraceae bacterium]
MTQFGKYQIEEQLGIGSMGVVYRARDTILDREVALKTIRAGPSVEPEVKERFYREARACARLQHAHIVTVYDLGEIDDNAYISMELLTGEDLRRTIESRRSLPLAVKISVIAQVADALGHAHRNDVIHRDIKPSNIFILSNNTAKVLDFGVARLPSSKLTLLGRVLGTPNYMAPEQIQGNLCDARSDLFSLALVFYELLTGSHPFRSDYIPRSIVTEPPAPLRRTDPSLPVALEEFFDKALRKKPNERFQHAEEFSAALRSILDGMEGRSANSAADESQRLGQPRVSEMFPTTPATSGGNASGHSEHSAITQLADSGRHAAVGPTATGQVPAGHIAS